MSPIDVAIVERSWHDLSARRADLIAALTAVLAADDRGDRAADRAAWLVVAVDDLVVLLTEPSRMGQLARGLAATWPCPGSSPCFAVDGRAWIAAAAAICPTWTARSADAWSQAWLLLSEELTEPSLSPFGYVAPGLEDT